MLEVILGIFGSAGFGSIAGLVGGYFNRKLDLQVKKIDLEDHNAQREHELKQRDKDLEIMKVESANKIQVATIEGDALVEAKGYDAMAESYKFAVPTPADGLVDKFSKLVRPVVTLLFLVFTFIVYREVQHLMDALSIAPTPEQVLKVYIMIIEWVLFQAGVCTGWWFAMRPGKSPILERK